MSGRALGLGSIASVVLWVIALAMLMLLRFPRKRSWWRGAMIVIVCTVALDGAHPAAETMRGR